ncbi:MAG: hypothetical protein J6W88_04610, partial [Bacteroidales bacterium]|nr:hypothetical protein [Bacteroidales bacterium]
AHAHGYNITPLTGLDAYYFKHVEIIHVHCSLYLIYYVFAGIPHGNSCEKEQFTIINELNSRQLTLNFFGRELFKMKKSP